jgi:hypothetical protein
MDRVTNRHRKDLSAVAVAADGVWMVYVTTPDGEVVAQLSTSAPADAGTTCRRM